ncbi:Uu.00g098430.m01.CDS01 [Anthostomella pinea]|uniref:Uu.00g098430.m01.CDS01 n=1 Tax=Anthostomella pinea TaxID=933095 RepID=A0AAI8VCG6_9PEZI|nr:Uu.00g098430.m01.CDS01 [Anthostomella pinea]
MDPMAFSDFTALKTLEISLPFVFGHGALLFYAWDSSRHRDAPDPTDADIEATKRYLVDMLPSSIETVRFAHCGDIWAAR